MKPSSHIPIPADRLLVLPYNAFPTTFPLPPVTPTLVSTYAHIRAIPNVSTHTILVIDIITLPRAVFDKWQAPNPCPKPRMKYIGQT